MHTAKILEAVREQNAGDSEEHVRVSVEFYKEGSVVSTRRFGYPLLTTEEEITEDLRRVCVEFDRSEELASRNAEHDEKLSHSDGVMAALVGKEIQ